MADKRDYSSIIRALRVKAESTEFKEERDEINRKITELETKYGKTYPLPKSFDMSTEDWVDQFVNRHNPWKDTRVKESDVKSAYSEDLVEDMYQYDTDDYDESSW